MTIHFTHSTKLMCFGVVLSLVWFLFESCDCDDDKHLVFFGEWVTCIDDKPTLISSYGFTNLSAEASGQFDPKDWTCKHDASSPSYTGSQSSLPYPIGPPPGSAHATTSPLNGILPPQWLNLPFLPHVPPPASPPSCQSSFPDVLATNQLNNVVTHIATCPFALKATIPVPDAPLQVAFTPDGSTALVTSFNNAVSFINPATNTVTYTLMTDQTINPHGLAIMPDGSRFYITSFNSNNPVIVAIDMASKSTIATIPTFPFPQGATLTPDGSQLWVTSPLNQGVDIIDTLTNTRVTSLAIGQTYGVAFNSRGTRAYITSAAKTPGTVYVVDTGSFQIITTYTVGITPTDIKMTYGDQSLVVNNNGESSVSVIDLVQNAVNTTQVGANPTGISFMHY